ncbi:MAG TPA: porin [Gammaproteobacteria bacterium]|nr:porin [Gammaproteobacteria bacterium]
MAALLTGSAWLGALALLSAQAGAADLSDRHELAIELDWNLFDARSSLSAWTEGGAGKLRFDAGSSDNTFARVAIEYRGQITPTLFGRVVADAIENAPSSAGLTEAYLEWRPLPSGVARNRLRFGAFYPPFSLENTGFAWESPYSRSFSAINAWLGEEIRPIGLDWRLSRPVGGERSPRQIDVFAGVFYGNDPAGTLLFWRGWSVHDRQTRLNERLPLAPLVLPGPSGGSPIVIERRLDPIAEIDDRPGIYLGGDLSFARRARVSLAFYDNRADPYSFRDGQWSWGTRMKHFAAQVALPGDIGLIVQHMRGDTEWLVPPTRDGSILPTTEHVTDEFDASFMLLSKSVGERHRVSLRFDVFDFRRPGEFEIDRGDAATLAYSYSLKPRLTMQLEWMQIESSRDVWPMLLGHASTRETESMLQLGFRLSVFDSKG